MGRKVVTKVVTGTGTAYVVELSDNKRQYLGLYAQSGSCGVSLGDAADHSTNEITIAEGNLYEVETGNAQVCFDTNGSILAILADLDAKHLLLSDNIPLTSDSAFLYYRGNAPNLLQPPVFS